MNSRNKHLIACVACASLLSGCGTLAPDYNRPAAPIADVWPASTGLTDVAARGALSWNAILADGELRELVERGLANNRDLRIALLNIEKSRAQFGIRRSDLFPEVGVGADGNMGRQAAVNSPTGSTSVGHAYSVGLGVSWELDLFGRLRSLKDQALQQYLATEATHQAVRLGLVAEISTVYMTLVADLEQLRLARSTQISRQESLELEIKLRDEGIASDLEVNQARAELEAARDQVAAVEGAVSIDRNALELLTGDSLPTATGSAAVLSRVLALHEVPAGLPSNLMLRRPDILASEHLLIGANAEIGAARASFFPSISLTGNVGSASDSLSNLFESGTRSWVFAPRIDLPIFSGGRLLENLNLAKANRDLAVASYEKSIQIAFREVADSLAMQDSLAKRLAAQQGRVEAAGQAQEIVRARYLDGASTYLDVLEVQRTLLNAQQSAISLQLAVQTNLVTLYKVTGGDWREDELSGDSKGKGDVSISAAQLRPDFKMH